MLRKIITRMKKCKVVIITIISTMVFVAIWCHRKDVVYFSVEFPPTSSDFHTHRTNDINLEMNRFVIAVNKSVKVVDSEKSKSTKANIGKKPDSKSKIWNRPDDHPEFFKLRSSVVNPLDFHVITTNNVVCNAKYPPFLTILILTMHLQIEYRKAIRETWGNISFYSSAVDNDERIKIVFLLGKNTNKTLNDKVMIESQETRDIVMFDFQDSYFNLTNKVLMGFKWIKQNCHHTKFVMKVDEDTFVDLPQLLTKLRSPAWNTQICGPYYTNEHCQREGKYKVAISGYPFEFYPPHVKGNIYFMPTDIALNLLDVSYYMPYCNMEDAYITGILAKAIDGVRFQNILGKYYSPSVPFKGCRFINTYKLASQGIEPYDARVIWTNLLNKTWCLSQKSR